MSSAFDLNTLPSLTTVWGTSLLSDMAVADLKEVEIALEIANFVLHYVAQGV
jgi:hypothetical protein